MRFILFLTFLLLISSCVKNIDFIWDESVGKDPITWDWKKYCPQILRNIDGSCQELQKREIKQMEKTNVHWKNFKNT